MITRHKMNGPRQTNGDLGLLWRSQKWRLPSNEPVFKHFLKKKKKREGSPLGKKCSAYRRRKLIMHIFAMARDVCKR